MFKNNLNIYILCGSKWTNQGFWPRKVFGVEVKKPVLRGNLKM